MMLIYKVVVTAPGNDKPFTLFANGQTLEEVFATIYKRLAGKFGFDFEPESIVFTDADNDEAIEFLRRELSSDHFSQ